MKRLKININVRINQQSTKIQLLQNVFLYRYQVNF